MIWWTCTAIGANCIVRHLCPFPSVAGAVSLPSFLLLKPRAGTSAWDGFWLGHFRPCHLMSNLDYVATSRGHGGKLLAPPRKQSAIGTLGLTCCHFCPALPYPGPGLSRGTRTCVTGAESTRKETLVASG